MNLFYFLFFLFLSSGREGESVNEAQPASCWWWPPGTASLISPQQPLAYCNPLYKHNKGKMRGYLFQHGIYLYILLLSSINLN
jgi:hypothetical protein